MSGRNNEKYFSLYLKKQFLLIIFHEIVNNKYHGSKKEKSSKEETSIVFAWSQKSYDFSKHHI